MDLMPDPPPPPTPPTPPTPPPTPPTPTSPTPTSPTPAVELTGGTRLRSGTAARLAGVPVATLRVWERRYGVVAAPKSASGQRLYSSDDVQRLRLLRQLTERGHAIGTLAALGLPPLLALWADIARVGAHATGRSGTLGVVVVGRHAAPKLAAVPGCRVLDVFDDLDSAAAAPLAAGCGLLLVQLASLQPAAADQVRALAARLRAAATVVLYAFGAESVAERLRQAGAVVRRDPVSAAELARLLVGLVPAPPPPPQSTAAPAPALASAPARQFSDDDLVALAEMPSNVACECPRHLAEIVMQLGGFESYSADCQSRSPADAALHEHLTHLAGTARSLFEQALQRVMVDEGLTLPSAARPQNR